MEDIKLIHGDSLQALKSYGDNHFDWAIVDPPYGIDIAEWDAIDMKPPKEYFDELMRASKNQIIWGLITFIYRILRLGFVGTKQQGLQIGLLVERVILNLLGLLRMERQGFCH